jgi:hypothetical protein
MNRRLKQILLFLLALGLWDVLLPAYGADESLITAFLAKRQALAEGNQVDVSAMSKAIRAAIAEGERLEREGKYGQAIERLFELQKFAPLPELPSFDVHMLLSWLYMKTNDTKQAAEHKARAEAMREILRNRLGNGKSPESPIQAIMPSDIAEWARMQLAGISDVKSYPFKGRELFAVTYSGSVTTNKPALAYFEIDPRVQAKANLQQSLYAPIPLESMKPEHRAMFEKAKSKREGFLNDAQFPYLELIEKVKTSIAKAAQLDSQGKTEEAMVVLKEVESIRPIEDVPLPQLISTYSFLNGRLGNTQKQIELRGLLFGINQVIAHSGDGLSPQTAVHVIAIDEEYAWLKDKRLVRRLQKVLDTSTGRFDVITAKDSAGAEADYYFNITRMYLKYDLGLRELKVKQ